MCEAMWCCCGGGGVLHVSRLADDGGGYSVLRLHSSVVAVFRFLAGVFPQHIGERGRFCCVSAQSCWNCKIHCRRVLLWWGPKYTHVHYNSVFLLGKKLAKVFWVYCFLVATFFWANKAACQQVSGTVRLFVLDVNKTLHMSQCVYNDKSTVGDSKKSWKPNQRVSSRCCSSSNVCLKQRCERE